MNNKGFTLVELITTFALAAIIIILLVNIVVVIKDTYSKINTKTELYINQSNLSNALNSKLNPESEFNHQCYTNRNGKMLDCGFDMMYDVHYNLIVTEKQIKFGNYTYNLDEKTVVESATADKNSTYHFLHIKIVIRNELYPGIDFGINLVYDIS